MGRHGAHSEALDDGLRVGNAASLNVQAASAQPQTWSHGSKLDPCLVPWMRKP